MGCDYYIHVYLEIEHTNGVSYLEFYSIRGYYCECECGIYDSDEEECDRYYNTPEHKAYYEHMTNICLTPRKPIVIYENKSFANRHFENKYAPIIRNKINNKKVEKDTRYKDTGKLTNMDQVIRITKKEDRYKR